MGHHFLYATCMLLHFEERARMHTHLHLRKHRALVLDKTSTPANHQSPVAAMTTTLILPHVFLCFYRMWLHGLAQAILDATPFRSLAPTEAVSSGQLAARCPGRSLDQQRSLIECGAAGSRQSQRSQSDIDGLVGLDNCQLELHPSSGKLGL